MMIKKKYIYLTVAVFVLCIVGSVIGIIGHNNFKNSEEFKTAVEYAKHNTLIRDKVGNIKSIGEYYSFKKKDDKVSLQLTIEGDIRVSDVNFNLELINDTWEVADWKFQD